jgi:formate hydrogenlyase subunit 3/multisubunit Na+/H+ antiporter MnhD subunit
MIKKVLSVIAGYLIFAVSAVMFFQLTGQKPHAAATVYFQIITAIYGSLFAVLAGYITRLIANTKTLTINYILAFIIAGFATFSLITSGGNHWTQLLSIIIFAPVSVLGGYIGLKKHKV